MLPLSGKRFKIINMDDKENVQCVGNVNDRHKHHAKEGSKTGVDIKNKIKNKYLFKAPVANKKSPLRKNTHIHPNQPRKPIRPPHPLIDQSRNISTTSSTKSFKSVTFSVDSNPTTHPNPSSHSKPRKGSILKNRLIAVKRDSYSYLEKHSRASSSHSHMKSVDQCVDNQNSNNIFLRKYEKLAKELRDAKQKFTDPIYPPCQQSIFLHSASTKEFVSKMSAQGFKIKWMRLGDLYHNKQLCIWHSSHNTKISKGFIHSSGRQNNYMQTVFNAINKSYILQKFFQNQQISKQGLYYIKMHQTQTNNWKYVMVDDFVPVILSNKKGEQGKVVKPAFLNVEEGDGGVVEIWPFLLQKAFAKYYSTYDSLIKGNTLDFLEELLGEYFQTFKTTFSSKDQQSNSLQVSNLLKNPYNVIIAQNSQGVFYPVKSNQNQIQILDTENNFKPQKIEQKQLETYFKFIHVVQAKKYTNHINCLIKQESHQTLSHLEEDLNKFILRGFTLNQSSQCTLTLSQKQERFHRISKTSKNKKHYSYSWVRMIVFLKQSTGYRWIGGQYACKKTLKMHVSLSAGEYFVVIMPEWQSQPFNLKLSLCSNTATCFERKQITHHPRIIQQGCMDLAQRFGKLIQINSNICSYNYIDYKVGFIIENINNEKTSGEVKILRTIDGLQSYNITPVNEEFLCNQRLEIRIPCFQSYTVVLKVSGGVDRNFLQQFDFGI